METTSYCEQAFRRLKVSCEGRAMMCCDQPYGTLGNVLETPPLVLWNSPLAKEIRECCEKGELHPACTHLFCPYKFCDLQTCTNTFGYSDFPLLLELDLPNTHCNIGGTDPHNPKYPACLMCPRSSSSFEPEISRLNEVCKAVSPILKNLSTLHIQGLAEPFYVNALSDTLDWLDFDTYIRDNYQMVVSTITNGILFNEETQRKLMRRCIRLRICFSMDAGTPETYRRIRRVNGYPRVKENLMTFAKWRNRILHELWINNHINTLNVDECIKMLEDAAEAEVNYVQFGPTDPMEGLPDITVSEQNYRRFEEAQEAIIERADTLGVKVYFRKDLHLNIRQRLLDYRKIF